MDGAPRKRIGRPRLQSPPGPAALDPTDEILAAAASVFAERGVEGATMAAVAARAGLRQSSLYYWFANKEAIVAELVGRANVVPLGWLDEVERAGGAPAVQLYRFIRHDVAALCELAFDINEVHRIAIRDRALFASYWAERAVLEGRLAAIVRRGIAAGSLRAVDPRLTALTLLSNDEAVQNWRRVPGAPALEPRRAGAFLADLTVGGLLASRARLASVRRVADRLDAEISKDH